jgi:hypothetical protein
MMQYRCSTARQGTLPELRGAVIESTVTNQSNCTESRRKQASPDYSGKVDTIWFTFPLTTLALREN